MPLRVHAGPMPHSHRLRHGRVSEPGRAYLCTTVVRERIPVFTDWRRGRLLVNALRPELLFRFGTLLVAGVVLPGSVMPFGTVPTGVANAVLFAVLLSSELIGRSLFFRAVSQPKMPGGLP